MNLFRASKIEKIIFGVALLLALIYGVQFYSPSFSYWIYKQEGGCIELKSGVTIRLKDGWFPITGAEDVSQAHIVFVKINPWFPEPKYLSKMDFIYKPDYDLSDQNINPLLKNDKFEWGTATIVRNKNVALVFDGKLRIYFDEAADLNEIEIISKAN